MGRIGGDEFIALVQNVNSLEEIHKIAKKLNNSLRKSYEKDNQRIVISASIGVTEVKKENSLKEICEKADKALYKVKYDGRDSYFIEK